MVVFLSIYLKWLEEKKNKFSKQTIGVIFKFYFNKVQKSYNENTAYWYTAG